MSSQLTDNHAEVMAALSGLANLVAGQDERDMARENFLDAEAKMPELFAEMRQDLQEHTMLRRLILKKKSHMTGRMSEQSFAYFHDDHEHLNTKARMLEDYGFLIDETVGNMPIFRMREYFVALLTE